MQRVQEAGPRSTPRAVSAEGAGGGVKVDAAGCGCGGCRRRPQGRRRGPWAQRVQEAAPRSTPRAVNAEVAGGGVKVEAAGCESRAVSAGGQGAAPRLTPRAVRAGGAGGGTKAHAAGSASRRTTAKLSERECHMTKSHAAKPPPVDTTPYCLSRLRYWFLPWKCGWGSRMF